MNMDVMGVQEVSPGYEFMAGNPTVPVGYKQTEVGVIPEDWAVKTLGSALRKGRLGGNYSNQNTASDYPLMKMGNLGRGYFDVSKQEYISGGIIPDEQHRLRYGDVVFNTRNTLDLVGKIAIWRDELPRAYYNSNLMRLEFNEDVVASNEYANYALNTTGSITRLRALATGTTSVAAIYTRDLLDFAFIVPPKSEQKAIATALSDVDALLEELDCLIAKKRDIKQAAMQQLLTGETRLPGFEGEWQVIYVKELADIDPENLPRSTDHDYSFNYISLEQVEHGRLIGTTEVRFENAPSRARRVVKQGDVLISTVRPNLKSHLYFQSQVSNAVCSTGFSVIRVKQEAADPRFIFFHFFEHIVNKQIEKILAGSNYPAINSGDVKSIQIPCPPTLDEQFAISEILVDLDTEIQALEQRRSKTAELKQGMMQELLTGRTRLV